MKIYTYNVNGVRSAINKGLGEWIEINSPDLLCLQELKSNKDQVDLSFLENLGYNIFWYSAEKKGYSGVAIFSKHKPVHIEYGCGNKLYDMEGRIIRLDFKNFSLMNVYIPSGSSGEERQKFKMKFLDFFTNYVQDIKKVHKKLIISGDFNICHKPIDIHNPVSNKNSSGFLPEERQWLDHFFSLGFIDTFRHFNKEPHQYSWWSFRFNARAKNLGWRIDYNVASQEMEKQLKSSQIYPEVFHSDHCPVMLEIS
jgi:exodeoxyribonuclease-3